MTSRAAATAIDLASGVRRVCFVVLIISFYGWTAEKFLRSP
jgi:hypothetical protein